MAKKVKANFKAYFFVDKVEKNPLADALNDIFNDLDAKLYIKSAKSLLQYSFEELALHELSKADLIIVESNITESDFFYLMGISRAMGKPYVPILIQTNSKINYQSFANIYFSFDDNTTDIEKFKTIFKKFIKDYLANPTRFRLVFPYAKKSVEPSYIIDIDKLEPREYDNLCFELISQMGFRRVSWGTEINEIDVIATLPKKDPDGFEYQELWLIVTGNKLPTERLLDTVLYEPDYLLNRLQKIIYEGPNLFSKSRPSMRTDTPITVLFILKELDNQELFERKIERAEYHFRNRKSPLNLRIRTWDQNYLINSSC